ncbi:MAG: hypothetical protein JW983_09970 [Elusimicrobia bacterium]|nr:hypothetical protein [Elusimicrobiota bacterium]
MSNNYIQTTFYPISSSQDITSTLKRVAFSFLPDENTDVNIGMSIFCLPKENIEKVEQQPIDIKNKI